MRAHINKKVRGIRRAEVSCFLCLRRILLNMLVIANTLALFLLFFGGTAVAQEIFVPTGSMGSMRGYDDMFTLTRLCDGRVLAAGGTDESGLPIASAEVYDPASGTWTPTGSMSKVRCVHRATLLQNCKVLVSGGPSGLSSAELYDPVSGTWSPTGSLSVGRHVHTSILLNNGKVLVAAGGVPGGGDTFGTASSELYDPDTGTWSPTGSLNIARYNHKEARLSDGRVLIAGGQPQGVTFTNYSSAEIYDPDSGTWTNTGSIAIGRRAGFTLTSLLDGKVLVAGGIINWTAIATAQAEVYDPATGIWTAITSLPTTRSGHSATLLADGKVLVAGGNDHPQDFGPGTCLNTALIYDPVTQTWSPTAGPMGDLRQWHHSTRLLDGRVLVAGGNNCTNFISTAELFEYQQLFTLTVSKTGTGTGMVTSNPVGIDCGGDCNEVYSENTVVTLTAAPDESSTFAGWSGACSDTGTCQVTMDAAKNVTATFVVADTTPDPFTFTPQTGVALNTMITSNSITVSEINAPSPISIADGEYSINSGPFTSSSGTVSNGSTVTVRLTSSGSYSTATSAILNIGGVIGTFSVTTITASVCGTPPYINVPSRSATGSFRISWGATDVSGATYVLQVSKNGGVYASVYTGTSTSACITGLTNGSYIYRVKATKSGYADSGYKTSKACVVTLTCGKPSFINVPSSSTTGSFRISWGATDVSGATYVLQVSKNGGAYSSVYTGTSTFACITGLTNGSYIYRVKATKSGYADSGYKTSKACAVTLTCGKPSFINVPSSSTSGSFQVSWGATDVSGATYVLQVSKNGGAYANVYTGTNTHTHITALTNGRYIYRVKATKTRYADSGWKVSRRVNVTH